MTRTLSRRDFLKLGAATVAGLAVTPAARARALRPLPPDDADPQRWGLGRAATWRLSVRTEPNRDADLVTYIYEDDVVPILAAVQGGAEPAHNRVWYQLEQGFVHSGWVQPVAYEFQTPLHAWPGSGFLVEVSIPFVDARWNAHPLGSVAYRMYYGAVFWVIDVATDVSGEVWYRIWDERRRKAYYVPGNAVRRIPDAELTPISPQVPREDKRLYVESAAQNVIAYEDTGAVMAAPAATGAWYFEDGVWKDYTTTPGLYHIGRKMPSRHMAGGDLAAADGFDLPGVPWVSYFSLSGMAFHGTYWHNDYGKPRSHGCVNVTPEAARWIYRWTTPHAPPNEDMVWAKDGNGTIVEVV